MFSGVIYRFVLYADLLSLKQQQLKIKIRVNYNAKQTSIYLQVLFAVSGMSQFNEVQGKMETSLDQELRPVINVHK